MSRPREIPEEIKELEKIYQPFVVGCHLENPTKEALEAFEKEKEFYMNIGH